MFIVRTKTLTTVLHVAVYILTQICVSGLAATVTTGGTTLNVQASKGYIATQESRTICMSHVKINTLNFDYALPTILTHQCITPHDFNRQWLAQLTTSN